MKNKAILQARQTRKRLMSNPATAARVVRALRSRNEVAPISDSPRKADANNNSADEKQPTPAYNSQKKLVNGSPATFKQDSNAAPPDEAPRCKITKQHLVPLWIFLAYLAAFGLSRIIYHFALTDNGRAAFDMLATYANGIPSHLNIAMFSGMVVNQMLAKRSVATNQNVLPGTTHAMELFERALKKGIPERHQHVQRFSRYILLMWFTTARQFSKPLKQEYPSWPKIQKMLGLLDAEIKSLERKEMEGEPLDLEAYDWTKAFLADMHDKQYFTSPGEISQLNQTVYLLKNNCDIALKFSNRKLLPRLILWVCRAVLHIFGWTSVLGVPMDLKWGETTEKWYMPSHFSIAYFLICFAFYVGLLVSHPFDNNDDEDTIRTLKQKIKNCQRFLSRYDKKIDDLIME